MTLPVRLHAETHPGLLHPRNEDSFAVLPTDPGGLLLAVCDGMGGMGRGDEASRTAILEIVRRLEQTEGAPAERLQETLHAADDMVRATLCSERTGRAGSTAVVAWIVEGSAHVAWVGDSRAYLVREGRVEARTRDHKLVEDLVDAGELTRAEAKLSSLSNVITRALGGRSPQAPDVEVEVLPTPWALQPGDRLLLCSDGLCDLVEDEEVPFFLAGRSPESAVIALVQAALARGGHDNITVVLCEWETEEARAAPPPEAWIGTGGRVSRIDGTHVPSALGEVAPELAALADLGEAYTNTSTAELAPRRRALPSGRRRDGGSEDGATADRHRLLLAVAVAVLLVVGALLLGREITRESGGLPDAQGTVATP